MPETIVTVPFTDRYGTEHELAFEKASYVYGGGVAIEVHCREDDGGWWECYGTLTKNLGLALEDNQAALDANNLPDLVDFVLSKGWARRVGEEASGFCSYPVVEFSDEFLDDVCVSA